MLKIFFHSALISFPLCWLFHCTAFSPCADPSPWANSPPPPLPTLLPPSPLPTLPPPLRLFAALFTERPYCDLASVCGWRVVCSLLFALTGVSPSVCLLSLSHIKCITLLLLLISPLASHSRRTSAFNFRLSGVNWITALIRHLKISLSQQFLSLSPTFLLQHHSHHTTSG